MIAEALSRQIKTHALECYPREACGLVLDGQVTGRFIEGTYLPVENTHSAPEMAFRIAPQVIAEYSGRITAVSHSHPDAPAAPSASDMVSQVQMNVPFIITATDGINCEEPFEFGDCLERFPLEGRPFRHGVTDCYELMRDYYWVNFKIALPVIPRDWEWWNDGLNLYQDYFRPAGFELVPEGTDPQKHDCFFLCVGSKVPNHGGIYLDGGMILHHLGSMRSGPYSISHLSVREYGVRWNAFRPIFVRYKEGLS